MDIVHELNQLAYGGVERIIKNIIKYDDKNTHTVVAYADGPFRKELEAVGANIIISPKEGSIDFDADIIHIHTGGAASEMAKNLGSVFTVVETIHSPVRSPMSDNLIAQRIGVTDAVTAMNSKCITIQNGIDINASLPTRDADEVKSELGIAAGIPIIGRVGRIGYDKYLEEWLLVCYRLQREGLNFIPLIVGGEALDAKGYIAKLKLMAASLPVKGCIFAGHKDNPADYMQIMDVFLYPSPGEGFGLVFIEAMLNESVVVSYSTDVTREICGGFSVLTDCNIAALAEGVTKSLDINIRDAIIPGARGFVIEQFTAQRMAADYQDLYERVKK